MGELTLEQKRALAVAQARLRAQGGQNTPAQDEGSYTGSLLPFRKDKDGIHLAMPKMLSGLWDSAVGAVTLPGDVYQGKVDPFSDEGIARATDLAGFATPVGPGTRAGAGWAGVPNMQKPSMPAAPTADALRDAAAADYRTVRGLGVEYSSDSVAGVARSLKGALEQDGLLDKLAPKTFAVINELASPPANSTVPYTGLEAARQAFRRISGDLEPQERLAAQRAIEELDRFAASAGPEAVVAGPAAAAAETANRARGNYSAAKRSDLLQGREELADLRASAANSGANYDNAMRSRLVDLLRPEVTGEGRNRVAGFTDAEVEGMKGLVKGDPVRNSTRRLANILGGGGGLGQFLTGSVGAGAGAALAGVPGAVVGGAIGATPGMAAKGVQNALARKALRGFDEATRRRSPLYEEMWRNATQDAVAPEARGALIKFLMELEAEKAAKQPQMVAPEA